MELVVGATGGECGAGELASLSGIGIDDVYPALGGLTERGHVREEGRRYSLTEVGADSVASLEAARREGIAAYVSDLDPAARRRLEAGLGISSIGTSRSAAPAWPRRLAVTMRSRTQSTLTPAVAWDGRRRS